MSEPRDLSAPRLEPSDVPVDAAPVDGSSATAPVDAAPSDAVPSDAVPSDAVPSDAAPIDAAPIDAAQRVEDEAFVRIALEEAARAEAVGDVPVGALVVCEGRIVGRGHNRREVDQDPLAHAEVRAIAEAAATLGRWRLSGCTLYVTLEPCTMCAGALVNARVDRLVYGATDPKAGAVESLACVCTDPRLNHRVEVVSGVLAEPCSRVLKDFFRGLRKTRAAKTEGT